MESELKPCPFCGSTDIDWDGGGHAMFCGACNSVGPETANESRLDAIAAWNSRPAETRLEAALKMALPYANGYYEVHGEKWCEMIDKVMDALAGKGNADGN